MKISSIDATISCNNCDFSFAYVTWSNFDRVETVYDKVLKTQLGSCPRCPKGELTIQKAKFKVGKLINNNRIMYVVVWRCKKCKQEWTQYESISKDDLNGRTTYEYFENNSTIFCPNISCACTEKDLVGIAREK